MIGQITNHCNGCRFASPADHNTFDCWSSASCSGLVTGIKARPAWSGRPSRAWCSACSISRAGAISGCPFLRTGVPTPSGSLGFTLASCLRCGGEASSPRSSGAPTAGRLAPTLDGWRHDHYFRRARSCDAIPGLGDCSGILEAIARRAGPERRRSVAGISRPWHFVRQLAEHPGTDAANLLRCA